MITKRKSEIKYPIVIRGTIVEYIDSISFLGVVLDSELSFKVQGLNIITKLARSLGMIRRVSSMIPISGLLKLYYAHFYSHLTYAIIT